MTDVDPILLELYRHRFEGVADEMGATLQRTSYSPNIKERRDFSCAIFDDAGGLVAQAAHIPVHLGAMPASVASALNAIEAWDPEDLVVLNDPYAGGTHLPDVTMVSPVFIPEADGPSFFVASRAHHADVGGMSPGSLPLATELVQEGLIIPPVKLYEKGTVNEGLLQLILRNVRTPEERKGDLAAQRAAHTVGARRLRALARTHGAAEAAAYAAHLQQYSARRTRCAIGEWPDGRYRFTDTLELANGDAATLSVTVTVEGEEVAFDFAGTDEADPGNLNAVLPITTSACYYVVQGLVPSDIPMNAGSLSPIQVSAPRGTIVNAEPPHAVAGGNVETSQRIVDVVLGALSEALPEAVPAAGQGTMNNVTVGGRRLEDASSPVSPSASAGSTSEDAVFAYYETIGGGMGAGSEGPGLSGVHVHMTNTLNTPVEALEETYPFRVRAYRLRRGSGGEGKYGGGEGLIREYEMLVPVTVTVLSTRRTDGPWGRDGGGSGAHGRNVRVHPDGTEEVLPAHFTREFPRGSRLRIETPGGGGYGNPVANDDS